VITAIRNLGSLVLRQEASQQGAAEDAPKVFVRSVVARVRAENTEIIKIIFSLDGKGVRHDSIRGTEERLVDYLWVGNASSNRPQNRLTTNQPRYLFSQTVPSILADLAQWPEKDAEVLDFEKMLHAILEKYFEQRGAGLREVVINRALVGLAPSLTDPAKIGEGFLERIGIRPRDVVLLFTVAAESEGRVIDLVRHPGYAKYLAEVLLRTRRTRPGVCHVCSREAAVLPDPDFPSGSPLKIYVVDKSGFMSGLADSDEARQKTFAVCTDCLRRLYAGVAYIQRHLNLRAGPFNVFLIPEVPAGMEITDVEVWCEGLRKTFGAINSFKGLARFQEDLQRFAEEIRQTGDYAFHILFGQRMISKFDFKRLIQDVPVSRLQVLREAATAHATVARDLFGEAIPGAWHLGFLEIARLVPVRVSKGRPSEWAALLALYDAILSTTQYPARRLIQAALLLARIHRFDNYRPYYIKRPNNPDMQLVHDTVKFNFLLQYLRDTHVLAVGRLKQTQFAQLLVNLPPELRTWMEQAQYDAEQQALFLLGTLIGKIGGAQYKKGDRKKAILDKVRFDGMDFDRVQALASRLLENLRIYRIFFAENEIIYAYAMALLNEHAKTWSKGPDENTFYILSGYSHATLTSLTRRKEQGESDA
jgi:CRISPR-associated protein Csh1